MAAFRVTNFSDEDLAIHTVSSCSSGPLYNFPDKYAY